MSLHSTFDAILERMPSVSVSLHIPTAKGFAKHTIQCRQLSFDKNNSRLQFMYDSRLTDFSYGPDEQVRISVQDKSYNCEYVTAIDLIEGSRWRCALFVASE